MNRKNQEDTIRRYCKEDYKYSETYYEKEKENKYINNKNNLRVYQNGKFVDMFPSYRSIFVNFAEELSKIKEMQKHVYTEEGKNNYINAHSDGSEHRFVGLANSNYLLTHFSPKYITKFLKYINVDIDKQDLTPPIPELKPKLTSKMDENKIYNVKEIEFNSFKRTKEGYLYKIYLKDNDLRYLLNDKYYNLFKNELKEIDYNNDKLIYVYVGISRDFKIRIRNHFKINFSNLNELIKVLLLYKYPEVTLKETKQFMNQFYIEFAKIENLEETEKEEMKNNLLIFNIYENHNILCKDFKDFCNKCKNDYYSL
jgi:hypothetical protein